MMVAEVVSRARHHLAEGPHWDSATGRLLHTDIMAGLVHSLDPATGESVAIDAGEPVGFAIPRRAGGLLLGVRHGVELVRQDGTRRVAELEAGLPDNRVNDGKCDPDGRLWLGTMSMSRRPGVAALYRLTPKWRLTRVLEGLTISNGLGWSPAGDRMYHVDSPTQRIDVLDRCAGEVRARRAFAAVDPADGLPDGLTVDAEGGVWIALFGGGAVRRYTPAGELDAVVRLPVSNPTSVAFGGEGLRTLFITTARHRLDDHALRAQPDAGAILAVRPGVGGLEPHVFGG